MSNRQSSGSSTRINWLKRLTPLAALVLAIALVWIFDLQRYASFEMLNNYHTTLIEFVDTRPLIAGLTFMVVYAAVIALSLPVSLVLSLTGGLLFGTWIGGVLIVLGATCGAITIFLIAKTSLGDPLQERAGPWIKKMEAGFQKDALNYLLFLRLVPVVPFWLVNLAPAFLGVALRTFAIATFFGIMPAAFIYASVGNGVGVAIDAGQRPDTTIIFQPQVLLPLLALATLALVPVAYRKYRERQGKPADPVS